MAKVRKSNPKAKVEEAVEQPTETTEVVEAPQPIEEPAKVEAPEPEVKEEPKAEVVKPVEVKEVPQPVVEQQAQIGQLNYDTIAKYLADGSISMEDKLKGIAANGTPELRTVASKLLDFEADFGNANSLTHPGDYYVSKCYDLNLVLNSVINTADRKAFKVKQDILTLGFLAFKESGLGQLKLLAYDYLWSFGDKELTTYQNLVVLFTTLSDRASRDANKGKISIERLVKGTTITEQGKTNLVSYYEL